MKKRVKTLPLVMTVLSALYLIYVISSEDTTLVADAVGGDPGGKLLPMIIAIFLFLGFLYITVRERSTGEKMDKETAFLFLVTSGCAVLYVLLTKAVGFIILTTVVLYSLEYLFTTVDQKRRPVPAVTGGVVTLALTVAAYTLMRLMTKTIGRLARAGAVPSFLGSGTVNAVIALVYVVLWVLLLYFTLRKFTVKKGYAEIANAGLVSFAVVLFLFVVFKQFFLVGLAQGLLKF